MPGLLTSVQAFTRQPNPLMQSIRPAPSKKLLCVLCAEDQPAYAALVVLHFEKAGHTVECVPNGQIAWEEISSDPAKFDLLVTDQQMPQLDGLSLVRRLRQAGFPGRIIVHAAGLTAEAKSQFGRLKVDAIVSKGAESDHLTGTAESLFQGTGKSDLSHVHAGRANAHDIWQENHFPRPPEPPFLLTQ